MSATVRSIHGGSHGIVATKVRMIEKGALVAFCDLRIEAWHLELRDCKWFRTNNGEWVGLPSVSYETREGKKAWKDLIEFTDKEAAARFQEAALAAVKRQQSEGRSRGYS